MKTMTITITDEESVTKNSYIYPKIQTQYK